MKKYYKVEFYAEAENVKDFLNYRLDPRFKAANFEVFDGEEKVMSLDFRDGVGVTQPHE